ncbi:MAG: hypothetical protein HRU19_21730 [Pseudobacteriovorax sp.]|nr:hypothetical protein [Pseudobacteriovorax sp.]
MRICFFLMLFTSSELLGIGRPTLSSMSVSINGSRKAYKSGDVIEVFKGDLVHIGHTRLSNGRSPDIVNLVGFRRSKVGNPYDDRDKGIVIPDDLGIRWSKQKKGKEYDIYAISKGWVFGKLTLRVVTPKINELVVSIDGKRILLNPGDTLSLREDNQLVIESVVGNFETADENFTFKVNQEGDQAELTFLRYGFPVASFPVTTQ